MRLVRKFVAISILIVFLLGKSEFFQLLRISTLIEHYLEHSSQDSEMNLFKFIAIHYAHHLTIDEDYDKDMKLPFKSNVSLISSDFLELPTVYYVKEILAIATIEKNDIIAYKNNFKYANHLSKIWQPPRLAA